jgi:hypothetical protein
MAGPAHTFGYADNVFFSNRTLATNDTAGPCLILAVLCSPTRKESDVKGIWKFGNTIEKRRAMPKILKYE